MHPSPFGDRRVCSVRTRAPIKKPLVKGAYPGGEGGIRTREPLRVIPSPFGDTRSNKKTPPGRRRLGGEGGIRTREPLRVTRAPGVRAKPDYATSPFAFRADELYQTESCASSLIAVYFAGA
jgi:hypothetical protein